MSDRNSSLLSILAIALALTTVAGCGDDESEACTPGSAEGCDDGFVCEEVLDGEPACFAPVIVRGRVLDMGTDEGIAGARVVAFDANGAARSTVVESATDGMYSLPVPSRRDADGVPVTDAITLRADAAGYQSYPTAPRTAIPVDLATAVATADDDLVVMNAATDIALIARDDVASGVADVVGVIDHELSAGVLVVAEQSGRAVASAITDKEGAFVLFDVPTSTTTIAGYRQGLAVTPVEVSVVGPETTGVVLSASTDGLSTVTGTVQIVNAPGGATTSVILVPESTFVENTARGEAPPGLRVAPVSGGFSIEGVAPGLYVALAAFENDGLVRDPDTSIGGTEIVHFEVAPNAGTVDLGEGFKVTEALAVVSPGAETIDTVTSAQPTFTWADDSSEAGYEVRVYDAFGNLVHENVDVPRVTGSETVSYTWSGAELEAGMIYQFRAWSWSDDRGERVLISATEDLRGVFVYQP
ncbi:hypothetical protein [Sandaracinus amylolyticus]|uniref:hypothetical protein n=1 Tax=Sandaracinus amylolyticus TaxID=927083 RepID=UPI001F26D764|nr:hypothetical protein [Sandaracinus amylolyticus]UJR86436.1 Hypothetical protein I5071_85310 [Sandaracinus amylolyticus]